MADATGETNKPLRVAFDRRIKLEFHGARITSDGGLLAYRDLDDALGLTTMAASTLGEGRRGRNIQHHLPGLRLPCPGCARDTDAYRCRAGPSQARTTTQARRCRRSRRAHTKAPARPAKSGSCAGARTSAPACGQQRALEAAAQGEPAAAGGERAACPAAGSPS
jgi:hypothetical protein